MGLINYFFYLRLKKHAKGNILLQKKTKEKHLFTT